MNNQFLKDCVSGRAYCQSILCNFTGNLNTDETISLKLTARVWNSTLVEVITSSSDLEMVIILMRMFIFVGFCRF